jgi:hypothetical protein
MYQINRTQHQLLLICSRRHVSAVISKRYRPFIKDDTGTLI